MSLRELKKGDGVIWTIVFFLCVVSIVEVFSASSGLAYKTGDFISPVKKHVFTLIIGIIAMVGVSNVQCKYFKIITPLALLLSVVTLVVVLLFGESVNGSARWINFLGIPFQPSEIAKGTTILAVAQILAAMQTPGGADKRAFWYIFITAGIICALIFFENFSTAVMLGGVVFAMMFIGGVSWRQLLPTVGVCAVCGALFIAAILLIGNADGLKLKESNVLTEGENTEVKERRPTIWDKITHRSDTWKMRILRFADSEKVAPKDYDLDENAQVGHANIAIVNSNIIGRGPGNSVQRDFLPQAFSDFIYAIIIEELGIFGAAFVCLLYICLLFRTAKIANRCENCFPAFLIMGLSLLIVVQAMFHMLISVGIAPVTGQPLPLISKGGTSTIITCIYMGIILSVSHSAKKNPDLANA